MSIKVEFLELPTHSESWVEELSCLWWFMRFLSYDLLTMRSWKVCFNLTQAKWAIIVHMHIFMKLMMIFTLLHALPHTQYISKCWPTYFHGLHSYQNIGTSCSTHIRFSWVTALDRQVISPFDSGTWVVQILGVSYFLYSVVLSRGSWESWPGYLRSMIVEAS